jgi:hypothetical protein
MKNEKYNSQMQFPVRLFDSSFAVPELVEGHFSFFI